MTGADLHRELSELDRNVDVFAKDGDGRVFAIIAVTYEPAEDDGKGHATSTGATIWVDLEEL